MSTGLPAAVGLDADPVAAFENANRVRPAAEAAAVDLIRAAGDEVEAVVLAEVGGAAGAAEPALLPGREVGTVVGVDRPADVVAEVPGPLRERGGEDAAAVAGPGSEEHDREPLVRPLHGVFERARHRSAHLDVGRVAHLLAERGGEHVGVLRALHVGFTGHHRRRLGERCGHPTVVLVAHRPDDEVALLVVELGERLGHPDTPAGVVRPVEHHQRVTADDLEAAGPVGMAQAAGEFLAVDRRDLPGEGGGDARVPRLVGAEQRDVRLDRPVRAGEVDPSGGSVPAAVRDRDVVRPIPAIGLPDEEHVTRHVTDSLECVPGRCGHQRRVPGRDVGLVAGDRGDRVAEDVGVFELDARDGGGDGIDDARGVVPAADTDLEDCDVDITAAELPECERGECLEERRGETVGGPLDDVVADGLDELHEGGLTYLAAVDTDALADVIEVWRGVQSDLEAGLPEHGLDHPCGAALSVRAGDLNETDAVVWVSEVGEQLGRGVRPGTGGEPSEVEQEVRRLVVLHTGGCGANGNRVSLPARPAGRSQRASNRYERQSARSRLIRTRRADARQPTTEPRTGRCGPARVRISGRCRCRG